MRELNVLIVEDDAVVGRDLRETVEAMGHRVAAVARTTDAALQEVEERSFGLALLDVGVPGRVDGIDLGHRLSGEWDIPVVYVTSVPDDGSVERPGAVRPLNCLVEPVDAPELRGAIEMAMARRDVRNGRRPREDVDRSEARYRMAFRANPLPVHIATLEEGRILELNPSFEAHFGYARDEAVGRTEEELGLWSRPEERLELRRALGDEDRVSGFRTRQRTRSGRVRESELAVRRVELEGVPALLVVTRDVTERVAFEEEMERRALYDALTGLPNRALLDDRLRHALERARREDSGTALLFIDLDDFKTVNDTFGHAAGDEVLRLTARRIRGCFREEDTVARLGGDEFVVILEDTRQASEVVAAARRVLGALEPPFAVRGSSVRLGASVGIALAPEPDVDADDLLGYGDAAMYRAKAEGGRTHRVFEPELDPDGMDFLRRKRKLRAGLEDGQFVLRFQPIVALETGRVVGAEALARWSHPDEGLILPAEFLPLAEEGGLAAPLGRSLLRSALGEFIALAPASPADESPFMAMNLPAGYFRDPEVVDELDELLAAEGADRARLVLEVSEGVALHFPATVRGLRGLGVGVALDDVGTGHVSLSALKDLTVDVLKIDRSLVEGLGRSHSDGVAIRSLLEFGRGMGHRVVAEGIENAGQAERLRELGCPLGQGRHFHEPLPARAFGELLAEE